MSVQDIISAIAHSNGFQAALVLIALDFVLGVAAAVYSKGQSFALPFIANFTHNDLLGKVLPAAMLEAAALAAPSLTIAGVGMGTVADGVWVAVAAALVGSIITSLGDFGIGLPAALSRDH